MFFSFVSHYFFDLYPNESICESFTLIRKISFPSSPGFTSSKTNYCCHNTGTDVCDVPHVTDWSCIRNEQTFPHWTWTIRNPNRAQEPVFYPTASWCVWTQPSFQGQFSVSLSDWICRKIGHIPSGHPSPDTSVNGNGFRILLVLHIKHWFNSVATA